MQVTISASVSTYGRAVADDQSAGVERLRHRRCLRDVVELRIRRRSALPAGRRRTRGRCRAGSLPAGLTLAAGGTISGTPGTAGSSSFTVRVTDSASVSATAALSLTINPPALSITTSSLPAGVVGTAYSQALGAAGGSPPYSWSVSSWIAAVGVDSGGGRDDIGHARHCGIEQLHGAGDGQRVGLRDGRAVADDQSAGIEYYDIVAASGSRRNGLFAGARRCGRIAAVLVVGVEWIAARGIELWRQAGRYRERPAAAGSSSFTVRVTDSASVSATAALSLTINPPALSITTSSLPAGRRRNCLFAGARRCGRNAAVHMVAQFGRSSRRTDPERQRHHQRHAFEQWHFRVHRAGHGQRGHQDDEHIRDPDPARSRPDHNLVATAIHGRRELHADADGNRRYSAVYLVPRLRFTASGPGAGPRGSDSRHGYDRGQLHLLRSGDGPRGRKRHEGVRHHDQRSRQHRDELSGRRSDWSALLAAATGRPPGRRLTSWSLTSGALPDGITLDSSGGSLSGTPTVVGSFRFTLRAADSVHAFAERQFQITTAAGLIITTAPVLAPATVGLQYGQSLDAAGGRASVCMVDQQRRLAGGRYAQHDDGSLGRSAVRGGHVPIHGGCERQPGAQGEQTVQPPGGRGARDFIRAGAAPGDRGSCLFPGARSDRRNAAVSMEHHLGRRFRPGFPSTPGQPTSRAFPRWEEASRLPFRSRTTTPSRHPSSSRSR